MYQRYQGDQIGEIDEDGIAQWYPKCKIRKEGDYYIATPHSTNPSRRRKPKRELITVSVSENGYKLAENKTNDISFDKENKRTVFTTTRKDLFNELYDKYSHLKPHERKRAIFQDMRSLFKDKDTAEEFVSTHWRRKRRNLYVRKKRFEYKAQNQAYEYFFTITYDGKKHTEESFEKSLKAAFSNLHKRYGCLFQGVWERGSENERLHFHGLIKDPRHKILGSLEEKSDYNPKKGRMKTYLQSPYFAERFGRNEFRKIIPQLYDSAINYITKYLSKQGVTPYYSKGLYSFVEGDIQGNDVLGRMSDDASRDIRLLVWEKFKVWKDGEYLGEASPKTLAQLPKKP